jgi:hypothetical protein
VTSKNLNCHFSLVSVGIMGVTIMSAYRSDCHAAATVPCSRPRSGKSYRHLGEAWGSCDRCASACYGLASPVIAGCLLCALTLPPSLFITPTAHSNYFSCAIISTNAFDCAQPTTRVHLSSRLFAHESVYCDALFATKRAPLSVSRPLEGHIDSSFIN